MKKNLAPKSVRLCNLSYSLFPSFFPGMDMYEDGMVYDQMKQILQVINESRDMARTEPENRSSQKVRIPFDDQFMNRLVLRVNEI